MKRLLYALLGLWLFGVQTTFEVKGQGSDQQVKAKQGVVFPAAGLPLPRIKGWVSPVIAINDTTTTQFYYLNRDGMVLLPKFGTGGGGGSYLPGVGLNLSAGYLNLNQYPMSVGNLFLDGLRWRSFPDNVNGSTIRLNNSRFLLREGDKTIETNYTEMRDEFSNYVIYSQLANLDILKGTLRRVPPVANESVPGQTGDYFVYQGRMYLNIEKASKVNSWINWPVDTTHTLNTVPTPVVPAPVLTHTGNPTPTSISLSWPYSYAVNSFRLFYQKDGESYQTLTPDIAAGARSYTLTNVEAATLYRLRLQALTPDGPSPLSNEVSVVTPPADNFTQWPNVKNVAIVQSGPAQFKIDFDITEAGGGVRFDMTKTVNPNPASDELFEFAAGTVLGGAGHYTLFVNNINDTQGRTFRYRRESSSNDGKTPSGFGTFGPVAIAGSGVTVNTPSITGVSDVTQTSVKLSLNLNNTSVYKVYLYRSLASPQNFTRTEISNTATSYTATGLSAATKYLFHLQVSKLDGSTEIFSQNSTPETEVTTAGVSSNAAAPIIQSYRADGPASNRIVFSFNGETPGTFDKDFSYDGGAWTSTSRNDNSGIDVNAKTGQFSFDRAQPTSVDFVTRVRVRSNIPGKTQSLWSNVLKITYLAGYDPSTNRSAYKVEFEPADQTPTGQAPPVAQPLQFTVTNITSSQATINVAGASGTKNYNWAVYRGEYNTPGSEFMSYYGGPIPSSGTFTVTISGGEKTLTPGTIYRMYVNLADNPNATRSWVEFTVPAPPVQPSNGSFRTSSFITN